MEPCVGEEKGLAQEECGREAGRVSWATLRFLGHSSLSIFEDGRVHGGGGGVAILREKEGHGRGALLPALGWLQSQDAQLCGGGFVG